MSQPVLIFDMDGVLVDVTESYRETIARTVERFTGVKATRAEIQECKNAGGWNDDWRLSHHLVTRAGVDAPFEDVKAYFQEIFRGNGTDGLMLREKWVARPGVLEKLSEQCRFAVFTGRPREEAQLTLARFAPHLVFDPIVAMEDTVNRKPAPDGLLLIASSGTQVGQAIRPSAPEHREAVRGARPEVYYIGDTVDDARAARAAGVPFIGIAAPSNPAYLDLVFLFQAERACAIIDDINYLPEVVFE